MFSIFKKNGELNHDILLLEVIVGKCNEFNGTWTTHIISNSDWKSIRFLNKRGLIKYFKADSKDMYTITPTLFCFYLTKVKKYDIAKVYHEATRLYNFIGENKNASKTREVLP